MVEYEVKNTDDTLLVCLYDMYLVPLIMHTDELHIELMKTLSLRDSDRAHAQILLAGCASPPITA